MCVCVEILVLRELYIHCYPILQPITVLPELEDATHHTGITLFVCKVPVATTLTEDAVGY